MARAIILFLCVQFLSVSFALAETRYFLGTRTGWDRTTETFMEGRYKGQNLFLVIGARPTTNALDTIVHWESKNTFMGYIGKGACFLEDQAVESAKSVPENSTLFKNNVIRLFMDPVTEAKNFDVITPALILWKTTVNIVKIGWYAVKTPCEPVIRTGAGAFVLAGSPFVKPAEYLTVFSVLTGTAVYGYSSSLAGGGTLLCADGAVCALDVATSPIVTAYELTH